MPGGVDMHCHIAGPKVNAGRLLTPDAYRDGPALRRTPRPARASSAGCRRPPPPATCSPASATRRPWTPRSRPCTPGPPTTSCSDTPILDNGFYVLLGNAHRVLDCVAAGDEDALDAYCAWALDAAKGYAIKVVNPGDVEDYKQVSRKQVRDLDEPSAASAPPPGRSSAAWPAPPIAWACRTRSTSTATTSASPATGGRPWRRWRPSKAAAATSPTSSSTATAATRATPAASARPCPKLLDFVRRHQELTLDVGHVSPGPAMILTGDPRAGDRLHRQLGGKWITADVEQESSCGVIPIEYLPEKNLIAAVQWAIALEWYLLMDDPWRIALTSDHPNGGAFYRYPEMIYLLMDRAFRAEALATMPKGLRDRSVVHELDREYSLSEIAILTRAAPARMLGLADRKGHLGPGADADIAIYAPQADRRAMFSRPRWVLKAGEVVVEDGLVLAEPTGRTFVLSPGYDPGRLPAIRAWFERDYSVRFANYAIDPDELPTAEVVACGPA